MIGTGPIQVKEVKRAFVLATILLSSGIPFNSQMHKFIMEYAKVSIVAGDIAQLVERTDRTREARGSNPLISKF